MLDVPNLMRRLGLSYQRQGKKLLANCPAHPDQTTRWMIRDEPGSSAHGRHRCLSCGFGGNAVGLVMQRLRLDYGAAFAWLRSSETAGQLAFAVEVDVRSVRRSLLEVPSVVQFEPELQAWPRLHREYLEARGVPAQQMIKWGIGFVAESNDQFRALRDRIWIPIVSHERRLAGWTARLVLHEPDRPKYTTSSRAAGTDRTVTLGEAFWPELRDDLYVVEGPFDALALDRLGLHVATLEGSYLAPEVAQKLSTFRRLILCTDPDRAGQKAAEQLLGLRRHMPIVRAVFPAGVDVADLAIKNPEDLNARLQRALR